MGIAKGIAAGGQNPLCKSAAKAKKCREVGAHSGYPLIPTCIDAVGYTRKEKGSVLRRGSVN